MLIKRVSIISGIEREKEISITQEQITAWENGEISQIAFPNISPEDRDFILTGIVEEEWEQLTPEGEL